METAQAFDIMGGIVCFERNCGSTRISRNMPIATSASLQMSESEVQSLNFVLRVKPSGSPMIFCRARE